MPTASQFKSKLKSDIQSALEELSEKKKELFEESELLKEHMNEQKEMIKKEVEELVQKSSSQKRGSFLDSVQERVISRKLLVFAAATSLFMWFGLDADTWGMIAMCYIGGQSAIDFAKTWKG